MTATAVAPHLFWVTSRAAGTAALLLSGAGVTVGAMMGGRLAPKRVPDRRTLHEILSLSVMAALIVHALALIGDKFLHPSLLDVTVPFVSSYKTGWTTLGIVAGWGTILLGLSFYLRARIGVSRWRILHRFTALAWIAGVIHAVGEGTDAGTTWFLALTALAVVPPLVAIYIRASTSLAARSPERTAPSM
jgi:sulfoxide reductase heme-binding subunit YedZ